MSTEAWFRNPNAYIRELVEAGECKIAWDRGFLIKRHVDAIKHAELYFGPAYPWRVLAIGPQGSAEYRQGNTWNKPTAVYPTWTYGEDPAILMEMIENPAGKDTGACSDFSVDGDERPVLGQEHRIVITDMPPANTGPAKQFLRWLKEVGEDNPDCLIHLHGLYSYRVAFGMGWGAADVDPRAAAAKGKVTLPSGKEELYERAQAHPQWITMLGFKPVDLAIPRNRCIYNIKTAVWAGENYTSLIKFRSQRSSAPVDTHTPDSKYEPKGKASPFMGAVIPLSTDKQLCDTCSLQDKCTFFRIGAVCSLPDADPAPLAKLFKTRDSELIIEGLGTLMAAGTRRLERGMALEETFDELDPEVTKMLNQLFSQGVSLAKLINPDLRGGVKVNVGVGRGGAAAIQVNGGSQKSLIAGIMRDFELQGISRDKVTTDMVMGVLEAVTKHDVSQQHAIEGTVVNQEDKSA